jgi:Protein of unknown function (DUF3891)
VLISRRGRRLQLVTHPDHAAVAGALAEGWGNARFAPPRRADSFRLVARRHDDGWATLDSQPAYNADALRPAHFLEVPLETSIEHYRPGVDALHRDDPYAGMLASMHWAGLYSARWGLQAGAAVGHPAARAVVAGEQRRWVEAMAELWAFQGPRSAFEAGAWYAYELLQAVDLLSLCLCTIDLAVATDPTAEPVAVAATLAAIDQPPGARIVPSVPAEPGGARHDLTVRVAEPGVVAIEPSPFPPDALAVAVPGRAIDDRAYRSAEAAASATAAAGMESTQVVIAPSAG